MTRQRLTDRQIVERLRSLGDNSFREVMDKTSQERVVRIGLEVSTPKQQESLAKYARTDEIATMFAKKLLPVSTPEQREELAKYGKTDEIATMFAKKLFPTSTPKQQEWFARYGKTKEIATMFAKKLLPEDLL